MRYIGNKGNIIDKIYSILQKYNIEGNSFFDFFSGTTNVAQYFKKKGYKVYSSDIMYLSYCLQKAYIENNTHPQFDYLLQNIKLNHCYNLFESPLEKVLHYLDTIPDVEGFIYKNYTPAGTKGLDRPRMYFSNENGLRIDAIRIQIEDWKNKSYITESEYYILISCLIETISFYANVAGVYAAFHKKWDPRAVKRLEMRQIEIIESKQNNYVHYGNSLELIDSVNADIIYLDPPYNERQYLPNYHLVETIAKYDNPSIKGISGMRNYDNQKSTFCNRQTAIRDLDYIAQNAQCKYLLLSYNSEGIMPKSEIVDVLSKHGDVMYDEFEHLRFKSNNNGLSKTRKHIYEQLYILKKL